MDKVCPAFFNNSVMRREFLENKDSKEFSCLTSSCAWWSEDAQKCAMLIIAESQRRVVKGK